MLEQSEVTDEEDAALYHPTVHISLHGQGQTCEEWYHMFAEVWYGS